MKIIVDIVNILFKLTFILIAFATFGVLDIFDVIDV